MKGKAAELADVLTLLKDDECSRWSNRAIARQCGLDGSGHWLAKIAELRRSLSRQDSDARTYRTKHGTIATMNTSRIGLVMGADARRRATTTKVRGSSDSDEWYTPTEYVEAAREVMGGIDLDPASCELANRTVRADRYYTIDDDGLSQQWYGRVFCNPPYGGKPAQFVDKLLADHAAGRVDQAVILVRSCTDTGWFSRLWDWPICFVRGRLNSHRPKGKPARNPHGSAIAYLGPNVADFARVFGGFGHVVLPSSS